MNDGPPGPAPDISVLLAAAGDGDRAALDRLFPILYDELHRLARAQRRQWHGHYTVNTTALVHEAYLKLVNQEDARWNDRAHFFALAATAMRHILSNYARRKRTAKRGGDQDKVPLDEAVQDDVLPVSDDVADELIALDDALKRLEQLNERQCRVVECRFFAGLPVDETAVALGISPATVKRDWAFASAWLRKEMASDD